MSESRDGASDVEPLVGKSFSWPAIFEGVEEATGYEVCRSYVKASGSFQNGARPLRSFPGPRRIRMNREKNQCAIPPVKTRKTAWQSMEKPFTTWGFLVERSEVSLPHR